jgi:hypothetical protein
MFAMFRIFAIFSGGRPEVSKRNLNFQSATWHHLKLTVSTYILPILISTYIVGKGVSSVAGAVLLYLRERDQLSQ